MKKLNAVEKSKYIDKRYKDYLRSSFQFGSGKLQSIFEQKLEQEELFKGPYVDLNLPFKRGKSLDELMNEGIVCRLFSKLSDINFTRPLYSHQEEAIRKVGEGRSVVITTGTGSGKTESFLYPILNDLLFDLEKKNKEIGIRAIFLYPMNALVNDQIDRVRKILAKSSDITYGFFTGETKENVFANYRQKYNIPENELVSRKEIRENPPHLLFTNYSMLEYLLIRPNDYGIFTSQRLKNWKYVVLDEAHSYHGSLGIELSLLMRRLTGLAPVKPRFILTSATLGEQGKAEREIVYFARNLTSTTFEEQDIIFSKRIPLWEDRIQYKVEGADYIELRDNIQDFNTVKKICGKYTQCQGSSVHEFLYDLLVCDRNVYEIYSMLKSGSKSFYQIWAGLEQSVSDYELSVLVDLINLAEKNGIGLFDLKYHSFVRPLSGAFITIGDNPKLSLTKTNVIDGLKAFEVGNCRSCSSPYIIGKIQHNEKEQLDYLFQNKEIDIYENYGDNEFVKLDYFLMESAVNEEEGDKSVLEEYIVCGKCGCVHVAGNLNAKSCKCDNKYKKTIYRIKQSGGNGEDTALNNINKCPCCGHKSKSGVVKSLSLGKDEGTAIIAQILFEAIDEGEDSVKRSAILSLKDKFEIDKFKTNGKVKQFLTFSDSRQQASFFASFLDANHVRMLQKRLIWKIIEDQNYNDITLDEAVAYLADTIKSKRVFSNGLSEHKNAWITLLVDLLGVDGAYDGEGLGLYYFDLDVSDIMDNLDDKEVDEVFGKFGITKADLGTIIQVIMKTFRVTPAVNYVKSTLTPEEKMEYLDYRRFDNFVMYNCPKAKKNVRSFLPVKSRSNMIVRYIIKACNCNENEAEHILDMIFNNLIVAVSDLQESFPILTKREMEETYQVNASRYIVKNYKHHKYFQCSKCGSLTPHNVHDVCIQDKCDGKLFEVNPDEALSLNYYRNQYKTKKIEKIVIEEHTAQLDWKTAKKYQRDFKDKKINILSCSTTFEMGIDIGDLETVFMRNVPPTPANYVQRAGRAGRRKDSAAYILTYCGTGSHDYTYFMEPEKMISGVISPPYFNVLNKKIIVRHLMAACLGYFFRQNTDYFGTIDKLVFGDGIKSFYNYVKSHPKELNEYISRRVLPESQYSEYHDFKWFNEMGENDEKMEYFAETILGMAKEYEEAKEQAKLEDKFNEAEYYKKQIENLHEENVITSLSKYCVIPKYGFPVDVVDLQIYKDGVQDKKYDLSRDLKIALSEYAPDSEVIVDKKKYTSKYITLPKTSEFRRNYFCTCSNCKKINVYLSTRTVSQCNYCGELISVERSEYFIDPINGFKTGVTKESTHMKPKKSYSGEVSYLGGGKKDEKYLNVGEVIIVESRTDDELLVMNRSAFYMCSVCGYSDIVKGKVIVPQITKKHKNYRQYDCKNEDLEQLRLGHKFQTDVAKFTIPLLKSTEKISYSIALSFLYAFLEGVSNALEIERNDIDGILELNLEKRSYDILLYDNVPGGAGHVKRLMHKEAIIDSLKAALNKVTQNCCDENTSCYNCLRNYYNQAYHSRLQRKYAQNFIESIFDKIL